MGIKKKHVPGCGCCVTGECSVVCTSGTSTTKTVEFTGVVAGSGINCDECSNANTSFVVTFVGEAQAQDSPNYGGRTLEESCQWSVGTISPCTNGIFLGAFIGNCCLDLFLYLVKFTNGDRAIVVQLSPVGLGSTIVAEFIEFYTDETPCGTLTGEAITKTRDSTVNCDWTGATCAVTA